MFRKLRHHFLNNVVGYAALFVALGGTAYAANTIGSADVIDESLTGADIPGKDATSTTAGTNGSITSADVAGQKGNSSLGQPAVNGTLSTYDVLDRSLGGRDLASATLTATELG